MQRGIKQILPDAQVDLCPIADGGEGTVDALAAAAGGQIHHHEVTGPLGQTVLAPWALLDKGAGAVIEMAAASGLQLVPPAQRDPTRTTTYGTGELVRTAMNYGAQRIILGIGGSATNDGGCGAAQALGIEFEGAPIPITGADLLSIRSVRHKAIEAELLVACDVNNPLTGPNGAAHIYGPQKGATANQVDLLDNGLTHLRNVLGIEDQPGAGAAGGFGYGAVALLGARLQRGVDLVLEAVDFDRRVAGCDLCLTGEGRIDGQSLSGKAIMGVTQVARQHDVTTIALVGSVGPDADRAIEQGLAAYHQIAADLPVSESMARAAECVERTAATVIQAHLESRTP